MRLIENDARLSAVCRRVEQTTNAQAELMGSCLKVNVEPNFVEIEKQSGYRVSQSDPTAYKVSEESILVNESYFFALSEEIQVALLAHEVGHHFCSKAEPAEIELGVSEDIFADWLVCKWDLLEPLKESRREKFGDEYCELLELHRVREVFFPKMKEWHCRRKPWECMDDKAV